MTSVRERVSIEAMDFVDIDGGMAVLAAAFNAGIVSRVRCCSAISLQDLSAIVHMVNKSINTVDSFEYRADANSVEADEMQEIARMKKVPVLVIRAMEIEGQSGAVVASMIQSNTTLTKLDLSDVHILDDGIEKIMKALEGNKTLTHTSLGLVNCDLAVPAIASMLATNTSLISLILGEDEYEEEGFRRIESALKHNNSTLLHFSTGTSQEVFDCSKIQAYLRRNQYLMYTKKIVDHSSPATLSGAIGRLATATDGDNASGLYWLLRKNVNRISPLPSTKENFVSPAKRIKLTDP